MAFSLRIVPMRSTAFCLSLLLLLSARGQDLRTLEDSMAVVVRASLRANDDAEKLILNARLTDLVERALQDPKSAEFAFDSLRKFRMLVISPDHELRIYNWAVQLDDKTFRYYGYLQHYNSKKKHWDVFELTDKSDEIRNPEQQTLDAKKWYGAFYSTIIVTKVKKKKIYTLLGWDGNDRITQKKLIETLLFTSGGLPLFGEAVIETEKEINPYKKIRVYNKRQIFEYKQGVYMTLKWHEKESMIVYDVLGPTDSSRKGVFSDYGPTLAIDGFTWEKGKWKMLRDPDVRNEKTGKEGDHNMPDSSPNPNAPK
ncbi:MAG: hypothetical protein IT233_05025 [Bacteroidia bacterium]|nr:hypothetical protein [Bacteroidia bacterium]